MNFGSLVKIVKDELTPSHLNKTGTVLNIDDRKVKNKPIRIRLMFGNIPMILSYSEDELELV